MKVVRIVSELDFGGVEQVIDNSLPELIKREGIEIQVIVLGKGGMITEQLIDQGVTIQILGFNPRIPNLKLLQKLKEILGSNPVDVVHCQGGEANFHGIWAAKLAKVPMIIGEEIGIPNHHTFWRFVFKWVYGKANKVIAISEAVKDAIVELGEVEASKVSVLYNPISNPEFQTGLSTVDRRLSTKRKPFVFVCTCRLVPIKNLDRLIKAFEGLVKENRDRELLLRIVGDGPERNKLETLSQKLEMGACVEFLDFQEDVLPFLNGADVFILASLREGSSVSLAEAMSVGLPSIVTKVGGAPEILGKSQSGILIDPLKTSELLSAMQQLLDITLEERVEMGQRAKEEARRFSIDHYIDSLLSIYAFSDLRLKPSDF